MGNMGYPVVTRLGINQFWYKNWYSDTSYMLNFKQDLIFQDLLKLYIDYGLTFTNNIFFNNYFFMSSRKNVKKENFFLKNLKHYRRFFFSNEILGIEHSYFLRYKTGEYFPMRLWLMRYSNWIIIFFNCFKPIKKKPQKNNFVKKEVHAVSPDLAFKNNKHYLKRFTLMYLFLNKTIKKSIHYNF